jgi:hypothetical protein
MPITQYGLGSLSNTFNPTQNNGFGLFDQNKITAVRVESIILDETHPRFKELGEWNAIGTIECSNIYSVNNNAPLTIAKPFFPHIKHYPLVNEIVYLIQLPSNDLGSNKNNTISYYLDIVALWNHPHHNGYPSNPNNLPPSQQKDYQQTQAGSVRRITDQSTEINLGKTFKERSNIHPLLPFEGDTIYEGRWGNSIRIGSTVQNTPNNWSSTGTNGDPILIFRNGQGNQTIEGWVPTVEDINNDESSIYLTSTQNIPLNPASSDYTSYKSPPPESPQKYSGRQILLSSGRLVFNTTEDHLLLSSNKSINLNSLGGVNIDTNNFTIQSQNIYLGSKNASEPLLLGDQTVKLMNQLISALSSFATVCSTLVSTPQGTPLIQLNIVSTQLVSSLNALQANLESLKSKYNYTV